nr:isoleucine N-monooxygenase 2-like [Ipomoea batatas]
MASNQNASKHSRLPSKAPKPWPVVGGMFPSNRLETTGFFRWMILSWRTRTPISPCSALSAGTNVDFSNIPGGWRREILKKQDKTSGRKNEGELLLTLMCLSPKHALTAGHKRAAGSRTPRRWFSARGFFGAGRKDGGPARWKEKEHIDASGAPPFGGFLLMCILLGCRITFVVKDVFDLDGHRKALKKAVGGPAFTPPSAPPHHSLTAYFFFLALIPTAVEEAKGNLSAWFEVVPFPVQELHDFLVIKNLEMFTFGEAESRRTLMPEDPDWCALRILVMQGHRLLVIMFENDF